MEREAGRGCPGLGRVLLRDRVPVGKAKFRQRWWTCPMPLSRALRKGYVKKKKKKKWLHNSINLCASHHRFLKKLQDTG